MNSKEGEGRAGGAARSGLFTRAGSAADPAQLSPCPRAVPTAASSSHLPLYHLEMVRVGFVPLSASSLGRKLLKPQNEMTWVFSLGCAPSHTIARRFHQWRGRAVLAAQDGAVCVLHSHVVLFVLAPSSCLVSTVVYRGCLCEVRRRCCRRQPLAVGVSWSWSRGAERGLCSHLFGSCFPGEEELCAQ